MLCEECHKRQAVVHFTKIVNNEKTDYHFCEECARQKSEELGLIMKPHYTMQNFFTGLLGADTENVFVTQPDYDTYKCNSCGLTFTDFRRTGRLGCGSCYEAFNDSLDPLLRRMHGASKHTGKVPKRTGGTLRVRHEIEALRGKLAEAIRMEEYEQAARLRDQIRELEKDQA
ncbi:MAG TPA: hypothetical protein DHD79_10550 [Firmicutes bacterium]|jgi:protein arginine kinase activator|nr:hypothetical protein [Bacillota bacterium]HAW71228.1 hypothetical protein [Bacillota bacterium]HAZ20854.1 hypothetical protein [Bacillota bacterium]HBE04921.1 hypothetical protein [Bacillota bacterium]HBG44009.1 hypothetical protein [Bacillota bacterium]